MTKLLTLEEMITCARQCEPDGGQLRDHADQTAKTVELVSTHLAAHIARFLGVKSGLAKVEPEELAGTCAPFYAARVGQPCPAPLIDYDVTEWSTLDGKDLDPETGKEET